MALEVAMPRGSFSIAVPTATATATATVTATATITTTTIVFCIHDESARNTPRWLEAPNLRRFPDEL